MRRPERSAHTGFTLVEAVVLISIVGILAVAAAPRFLSVSDLSAVQAHRRALSDLRYARQLASASGCPVEVDFQADGYRLLQRTGCRTGTFTLDVVDPVTNAPPFAVTLAPGEAIVSTVDPMRFDALGRATTVTGTATNVDVTIAGRALEVVGETGIVRAP